LSRADRPGGRLLLIRTRRHRRRVLRVFVIAESGGFKEVWVCERPIGLFRRISSILILHIEMTEIVAQNTRISIVTRGALVIIIFPGTRWLGGRLLSIAFNLALDFADKGCPSFLDIVFDDGKIVWKDVSPRPQFDGTINKGVFLILALSSRKRRLLTVS
jgi:hypothetical protein